jgi:acetolactate synthase-1/2/3 large subunit
VTSDVERPVDVKPRPQAEWGSDAVADILRSLGTPYLPMNPGSSFRGLHDSVVNYGGNSDPQLLLCLHEEIAVSLAHGWSKATGRLGVAAIHDLVGLMHASMAVYNAFCDRTPMLLLGGSGPADPALRRTVDWAHSATTQAQLVRDYVLWDAEPVTPAAAVSDVVRASQRAMSAPRGPTYVSLDAGLQEQRLDQPLPAVPMHRHAQAPPLAPDATAIAEAALLLARARMPVVVAGRVGLDPSVLEPLNDVVTVLGAAYRDDRNWSVLPTNHPQNCTGDKRLLDDADVVLAVDVVDLPALLSPGGHGPRGDGGVPRTDGPTVIDLSHGDLGLRSWSNAMARPVARDVQLLADPVLGLRLLAAALWDEVDPREAERRRVAVVDRAASLRARQRAAVAGRWAEPVITPARLVSETWSAVRDTDPLLCVRNTRTWPEGVWELAGAGSYLGHSGGGGVGYGPGALVGGALAARDRGQLGVGIVGDGDLLMAAGALWTAVHYRVPALVVVNDNGSFYNDEPHQAAIAKQRGRSEENSWIGMRIDDPGVDIAALARSYGCWAEATVSDPDCLAPALRRGVAAAQDGATAVVHVKTAPR